MICYIKNRILMQFHITGKCNLKCKHCYREEGNVEPLSFEDVIHIFEDFKKLVKAYNKQHNIRKRAHINITGGEPFIRKDIKKILSYIGENKKNFSYGILSNGSFIDDEIIKLLKETEVSFVQLSIDGTKETHDYLRAEGDYERVLNTASYLEKNGIRTYISFTANKGNYKDFRKVVKEARKRKITKVWSDRIVPIGNGEDLKELEITPDILPLYLKEMKKAQGGFLTHLIYPKTQVTMNRALQFLSKRGSYYSCSAGDSLITVDEFGNIMPCRRMPIICGNALTDSMSDIYFDNEIFKELRQDIIPKECYSCLYQYCCKGGAKCQSYAKYESFYKKDPGCPI